MGSGGDFSPHIPPALARRIHAPDRQVLISQESPCEQRENRGREEAERGDAVIQMTLTNRRCRGCSVAGMTINDEPYSNICVVENVCTAMLVLGLRYQLGRVMQRIVEVIAHVGVKERHESQSELVGV